MTSDPKLATPTPAARAETRRKAGKVLDAVRADSSIAESLGFSRHIADYDKDDIEIVLVKMAQEIEAPAKEKADEHSALVHERQLHQGTHGFLGAEIKRLNAELAEVRHQRDVLAMRPGETF